jgi:hypothetical protein
MQYHGPEIGVGFLIDIYFGSTAGIVALSLTVVNFLVVVLLARRLLAVGINLREMTIVSFFLIVYFVVMCLPAVIFFVYYEASPVRYPFFVSVQLVPILVAIGAALANQGFRGAAQRLRRFSAGRTASVRAENRVWVVVNSACLVASAIVVIAYMATAKYVPLFGAFRLYGVLGGDEVRFSIYESPDAIILAYAIALRFLLPLSVLYAFFRAKLDGGKWRWYATLTFCWAMFAGLLTFERQLPISLVALLLLAQYMSAGRRLTKVHFLTASSLALVAGVVSLVQYNNELTAEAVVSSAVYTLLMRVWVDPSYITYAMYEIFDLNNQWLLGSTVRLLRLIGVTYTNWTAIGFLADLWINFRWIGVLVGPVAMGGVLQAVQLGLFVQNSIGSTIFFILFCLNAVWMIYSNMVPTMVVIVFSLGCVALYGFRVLAKSETPDEGNQSEIFRG